MAAIDLEENDSDSIAVPVALNVRWQTGIHRGLGTVQAAGGDVQYHTGPDRTTQVSTPACDAFKWVKASDTAANKSPRLCAQPQLHHWSVTVLNGPAQPLLITVGVSGVCDVHL